MAFTPNKKYKRKSTKRAFAPSGRPLRPIATPKPVLNINNPNPGIGAMGAAAALRKPSPGRAFGGFLLKVAAEQIVRDIAGTVYQVIKDAPASPSGDKTIKEERETITGRLNSSGTLGRTFKTYIDVGQPSTKSVERCARDNGSQKLTHSDTLINWAGAGVNRRSLRIPYGFNRKEISWFDSSFYWSLSDLKTLSLASAASNTNSTRVQKVYWLTKYFGNRYTILNTNKYLKTKVKVHFMRQTSLAKSAVTCLDIFCSPTAITQNNGAIPLNYQFSDLQKEGLRSYVAVHPNKINMKSSTDLNVVMSAAYTVTKTLMPGESLEITQKYHTGPGLRLDHLFGMDLDLADFDPLSCPFYYPVFEVVGTTCEAYNSVNVDDSFIGTSPGEVRLESQKFAEICLSQPDARDINNPASGFLSDNYAYRVYNSFNGNLLDTGKLKNIAYPDILREGEVASATKYVIPVATDNTIRRGGKSMIAN